MIFFKKKKNSNLIIKLSKKGKGTKNFKLVCGLKGSACQSKNTVVIGNFDLKSQTYCFKSSFLSLNLYSGASKTKSSLKLLKLYYKNEFIN
jgi:hypothetical protein